MRLLLAAVALLAAAGAAPLSAQTAAETAPAATNPPAAADSVHSIGEFKRGDCADMCPPAVLNAAELQREIIRQYPPLLRDAGIGGVVVVAMVVDTTGAVERGSLRVEQSDHAGFSQAALRVLPALRFSPARLKGRAVRVSLAVPVTFSRTAPTAPAKDGARSKP